MRIKFVFLFFISLFVVACASKEQKMSEELLKSSLKAPSTYKFISFEQESVWTIGSELEDRIGFYQGRIESDKRSIDSYSALLEEAKNDLKDSERERKIYGRSWDKFVDSSRELVARCDSLVADANSKLERDQHILEVLTSLTETEDLSRETGWVYALTYEAQNAFGVPLKGVFRTHFKLNGDIVECKSEDEGWQVLGDVFSIPGYYELIGVSKE